MTSIPILHERVSASKRRTGKEALLTHWLQMLTLWSYWRAQSDLVIILTVYSDHCMALLCITDPRAERKYSFRTTKKYHFFVVKFWLAASVFDLPTLCHFFGTETDRQVSFGSDHSATVLQSKRSLPDHGDFSLSCIWLGFLQFLSYWYGPMHFE